MSSVQVPAVLFSVPGHSPNVSRRHANFAPSIWGDYFLSYPHEYLTETNDVTEYEKLKDEVKSMLTTNANKASQKLDLIDAIQRLGVSYHFESEIEEILKNLKNSTQGFSEEESHDLYTVSLKFRLLRQQGYKVSCDIFKMFKDSQGNFKDSLIGDARGMLSLYEATHLRVHGEKILDEALAFATTHLEAMPAHLNSPLVTQTIHALKQPIRKGLPRLEARHYFSIYQKEAIHNEVLLTFAKLDFNMLQKLHQKEISEITKWWKELNFAKQLPFARDRVVEGYFWILGVFFEAEYSVARKILTKVIAIASVIDDIYDVYGTIEELQLFTDAIKRLDIGCIKCLPEYMSFCYKALLDVYEELEKELTKQRRSNWVHYAKEAMKNLVQAYFAEAKWFNQSHTPTLDEYLRIALVSCGYPMLTVTSFVAMGQIVTEEAFQWLSSDPQIFKSLCVICRLMDDIVTHKVEQERGDVASAVECYMNDYGISEEQARDELRKQIVDAWKDINEAFLRPTEVPVPLLTRILNLARVMDVVYKDGDEYTNSKGVMKNYIASLLVNDVPL